MPDRRRPPSIDPEPDARMLRFGWLLWAVALLVVAGFALTRGLPATTLPTLVPLGALLLLWPAWRGGLLLWRLAAAASSGGPNGHHYEFDGRPVRVVEDVERRLWFVAADVLDALGVTGRARDPARLRLGAGRDGVVVPAGARHLCFSERGLLAWLDQRTGPRVAGFRRWLLAQVLQPHWRRVTIETGTEPAQPQPGPLTQTARRRAE